MELIKIINEVKSNLATLDSRVNNVMNKQLNDNLEKFKRIMGRTLFEDPYIILEKKVMKLDGLRAMLSSSSKEMIEAITILFDRIVNKKLLVRRINIGVSAYGLRLLLFCFYVE